MIPFNLGHLVLVACAYIGMFFLLPYLLMGYSGRHRLAKFWIGGLLSHLYIIFCVYLLAFIGIYNTYTLWAMIVLMAGLLFYRRWWKRFVRQFNRTTQDVSMRMDGVRNNKLVRRQRRLRRRARFVFKLKRIRPIPVLYGLFILFCFAMILYYRTNYMTQSVAFSTADLYVHLEWVKHLGAEQVVFFNGVYPYGMQNICSAVSMLFNIDAYSVIHCIGPVNGVLVALAFYLLLRNIFKSRVAIALSMLCYAAAPILSNSGFGRLSHALPQDFGLWGVCLSGYFMWKFLRSRRRFFIWMWGCAVLLTLLLHLFAAGMAVVVSLIVLLCSLSRVRLRRLRDIGISLVLAAALGFAPMLYGRIIGIEWEHSLRWGMGILTALPWVDVPEEEIDTGTSVSGEPLVPPEMPENPTTWDHLEFAAGALFLNNGHKITLICMAVSLFGALLLLLFRRTRPRAFLFLAVVLLVWIIYLIVIASGLMGQDYDVIVAQRDRLSALFMVLVCTVFGAPVDILYSLVGWWKVTRLICAAGCSLVVAWLTYQIVILGHMRPQILIPQSQYNGVVEAYYQIIEEYPNNNWTIVSPVEEYTMVIGKGYHYELYRFFQEMQDFEEDTRVELPTPYVFIVTEKRPLEHYRTLDLNHSYTYMPRVDLTTADMRLALQEGEELREFYTNYEKRTALEAKAAIWAQKYSISFPKEMSVYYEDEEICIYRIVQQPYALNNFAIDYGYN